MPGTAIVVVRHTSTQEYLIVESGQFARNAAGKEYPRMNLKTYQTRFPHGRYFFKGSSNPADPTSRVCEPRTPALFGFVKGEWGGRSNPGEPPLKGAARELFEEAGLDLSGNLPRFLQIQHYDGVNHVYRVEIDDAERAIIDGYITRRIQDRKGEVLSYQFLPIAGVRGLNLNPQSRGVLQRLRGKPMPGGSRSRRRNRHRKSHVKSHVKSHGQTRKHT